MIPVTVLRIGHRPERDQRVTTHVGLTARAFGAEGMLLAASDKGVVASIRDVADRFGGTFTVEDRVSWRTCIREWKEKGGTIVHLTMYGLPLPEIIPQVRTAARLLVVVGAEKVPGEVFGLADFNVSVTSQPHSEIAGLAVFLDRLFDSEEFELPFPDARVRVVPTASGKRMEEL